MRAHPELSVIPRIGVVHSRRLYSGSGLRVPGWQVASPGWRMVSPTVTSYPRFPDIPPTGMIDAFETVDSPEDRRFGSSGPGAGPAAKAVFG
ncbi:hypothetical protein CHELA20_53136 [Hyphomicrobiales bacterium]|nr:hypothetical protein CHELA41_21789 [Hyphomicrobiales bacterium]CAH1683646.1 hypothetical protein CHELA20_53136 [Hyphomicrobiales bacterium]